MTTRGAPEGAAREDSTEGGEARSSPQRDVAFDPSDPFDALLGDAQERGRRYLRQVDGHRVMPTAAAVEALASLGGSLPAMPSSALGTLALLDEVGGPATVAQMGGRYFGFVNGGALPIGLAARWLGDAWDQNAAHFVMSPTAARLEEICEAWVAELLGLPPGTAAGFVTGTMLANFSGMAAARGELLRREGYDVRTRGLYGAPQLRVVLGEGAHAAVYKALSLLGMGSANVETIVGDAQGALDLAAFEQHVAGKPLDARTLVLLQAGNVNSGAFDPIGAVCQHARDAGAWVHVDGAFGLWARASPEFEQHTRGWELADSWALDAHKTLNAPYDCGVALCRDRAAFTRAFEASATYFQWGEEREGMRYTPSMSKRARAVELWAILRTLGRSGTAALVEQLCSRARLFASLLRDEGFLVLNDVVFNQVVTACENDERTERVLRHLQESGECWCGGSRFAGRAVIRISVCSWRTTEEDVRRSVRAFVAARQAVES